MRIFHRTMFEKGEWCWWRVCPKCGNGTFSGAGEGREDEVYAAAVKNNPKKILGYPSFARNYAGS